MKKILVVDDDEAILEAFELALESAGYSVQTTDENGEGIKKIIKNNRPDLIILDVLLSGHDGRDICRDLKKTQSFKDIPVIMASAHPDARETSVKAGADDFLSKPFDIDVMLSKIEKHTSD